MQSKIILMFQIVSIYNYHMNNYHACFCHLINSGKVRIMKTPFHPLFSSVQFSCSVMSDSLQPHESQHARPPCPSPAPGVYSNSCLSSHWCHPAISSSVVPFSSCPQSLPASGSFPMAQLFAWDGQITGISASTSVHPGLVSFRMDWLDLLAVQGTLKSLLQYYSSQASIFRCLAFFTVQLSHPHMTTEKTIALSRWTFVVIRYIQIFFEYSCSTSNTYSKPC